MGTQFPFLYFQSWRIDFGISFAAPPEVAMIFRFVGTIAFDAFGPLNSKREHHVTPFPTIFTLWNTWVHVSSPNGCDMLSNIETSVD